MNRLPLLLAAVAAIVVASFGVAKLAPPDTAGVAAVERQAVQTARFAVDNMTCAACPITVRTAILRLEGVTSVEVDFEAKTATVVFDAAIVSRAEIAEASADAGYPARIVGG